MYAVHKDNKTNQYKKKQKKTVYYTCIPHTFIPRMYAVHKDNKTNQYKKKLHTYTTHIYTAYIRSARRQQNKSIQKKKLGKCPVFAVRVCVCVCVCACVYACVRVGTPGQPRDND